MLLCALTLPAQQQRFKQYGSPDGLTNLNIYALLQDRVGFLWVGTDNGLFKYDGSRFREYGHEKGLPSTEVHALAQSPVSGQLWLSTMAGLARLDEGGTTSAQSWPDLAFGDISQISFDHSGRMYLLRRSQLLECDARTDQKPTCQAIVSGDLQSLLLREHSLLFSRAGRLWIKEWGRNERLLDTPGLPIDKWRALLQNKAGDLWVRSDTRLFERCARCIRFVDRSSGVEHNQEPHLAEDDAGHVLVSTLSGAVAFGSEQRVVLDTGHGASDDAVGPLLVDRGGNLWMGMAGGGVLRRLGQGAWSSWRRENGLLNNSVWAIERLRNGTLWVGSSAGLTIFGADGKYQQSVTTKHGLPSDRVLTIRPTATGDVFVGTDPGGLTQLSESGKLLRVYAEAAGLRGRVSAAVVDRLSRLWVVGNGGVFRSQPLNVAGEVVHFDQITIPLTSAESIFRDVIMAEDGGIWVAGSEGLFKYSGGTWKIYTTKNGLAANDLEVLAEQKGVLWVAYRDALGISRFTQKGDRLVGTSITKGRGLSSDVVYALGFDHQGRLWATSDRGADVLEGTKWEHFDSSNGLIWDDTNSHALSMEDNDAVWIGTSEGMSRYTPSMERTTRVSFPTVITDARSGNYEWSPREQPELSYKQRGLELRFASLDFANPPASFRYRLSGYQNGWVETQGHGVRFEALPPGSYLFEVEAQKVDGTWILPCQFRFRVRGPWWQSWYSITGCVALGLASIFICWRLKVTALLRQKERLQQQVNRQTNELRQNYDRMAAIAYLDQLTSIPNRRRFSDQIRERSATGIPLILLLVDLDHFKTINDTHGHDTGDAVLITTAARLQSAIEVEGLVARLGGDEFAVLFDAADLSVSDLEQVCARILEQCSAPILFRDRTIRVACSIGIAISGLEVETEDELYKTADTALYEAKRGGRNRFHINVSNRNCLTSP